MHTRVFSGISIRGAVDGLYGNGGFAPRGPHSGGPASPAAAFSAPTSDEGVTQPLHTLTAFAFFGFSWRFTFPEGINNICL